MYVCPIYLLKTFLSDIVSVRPSNRLAKFTYISSMTSHIADLLQWGKKTFQK
uniref:Uncharacterized protein n=1 Tax=Anguilla anguilla TaxID=7936 RepID=A0A0E9UZA9_ANGAN